MKLDFETRLYDFDGDKFTLDQLSKIQQSDVTTITDRELQVRKEYDSFQAAEYILQRDAYAIAWNHYKDAIGEEGRAQYYAERHELYVSMVAMFERYRSAAVQEQNRRAEAAGEVEFNPFANE